VEGIPAVIVGVVTLFYLTDHPSEASWLPEVERSITVSELADEHAAKAKGGNLSFRDACKDSRLLLLMTGYFFSDVEHDECLLDAHVSATSLASACDDGGKSSHASGVCGIDRFAYQFLEFGQIRRTEMAHSDSDFHRGLFLLTRRDTPWTFCFCRISGYGLLPFFIKLFTRRFVRYLRLSCRKPPQPPSLVSSAQSVESALFLAPPLSAI